MKQVCAYIVSRNAVIKKGRIRRGRNAQWLSARSDYPELPLKYKTPDCIKEHGRLFGVEQQEQAIGKANKKKVSYLQRVLLRFVYQAEVTETIGIRTNRSA